MKKFLILIAALFWVFYSDAHQRAMISKSQRDIAIPRTVQKSGAETPEFIPVNSVEIKEIDFETIGYTYYDLHLSL